MELELFLPSSLHSPFLIPLSPSFSTSLSPTGGVHSSVRGRGPGGGAAAAGGELGISEDSADRGRGPGGPGYCRGLFC